MHAEEEGGRDGGRESLEGAVFYKKGERDGVFLCFMKSVIWCLRRGNRGMTPQIERSGLAVVCMLA